MTRFRTTSPKALLASKKAKQVLILYSSMVMGIVFGFGVSILNTRLLGPKQFGDLRFLQNLYTFVMPFMTIGIFFSASRLLAQNKHESKRHKLTGSLVLLAALMSLALTVGFFFFSFFEETIFKNSLGPVMRFICPFLFIYPFQLCLENILPSGNKIYTLAVTRIGPQILFIVAALTFSCLVPLSLTSVMLLQLLASAVIILAVVILLKPDFTDVRKHFSLIWQENKAYGLHVYVGAITGVVSADLGGVSIGYFVDTTHVGFYSLALTTVMPLAMIPSVVGTTFFKDFANMNFIPRKVVAITLLLSIGTLLVFFIAIKYVILLFYSSAFAASIPLAYILSIAFTCNGYGDFINRFLAAHGRGREMRNSNFAICATNLFGYTFLVYAIGILGAAITKLCGSLMYLCMMNYYYRRYRKGVVQQ